MNHFGDETSSWTKGYNSVFYVEAVFLILYFEFSFTVTFSLKP